jgi:serine/threonine protein kinase
MDRYEPIERLGRGGFGEVWRVRRIPDGVEVALKQLRIDQENCEGAVERFTREVRRLESLSHPNVVRVLDKSLTGSPYFFVMPLFQHTLEAILPALSNQPVRFKAIFESIMDAVEYGHREGVLHRDLTPRNVLLDEAGNTVVSDFGLARDLNEEERLTCTGQGFGTHGYVSPEQWSNAKTADKRTDIYSLGRILYVLAGGLAHEQDIGSINPVLGGVVQRATYSNPAKRFASVSDLKVAFESAMSILLGSVEEGSIDRILDEIATNPGNLIADVPRLQRVLVGHEEDGDMVHKALMKLPAEAFQYFEQTALPHLQALVTTFARYTADQSWSFTYTDQIGNHCAQLFNSSTDVSIRMALLKTVLEVGASHYRFDVMRTFGLMLQASASQDEAHYIMSQFNGDPLLQQVKDFVEVSKLPFGLSRLFAA